jgi:hypothetical protein
MKDLHVRGVAGDAQGQSDKLLQAAFEADFALNFRAQAKLR